VNCLDNKIKDIISKLNVTVIYSEDLDSDGHYIAAINTIIIRSSMSERNRKMILLHELGHAAKHNQNFKLYNLAFSLHSKMEQEAEEFMIEQMIETRFYDPEFNPETFNSINFLESYELDYKYEQVVKVFMSQHMNNKTLSSFI